MNRPHPLRCYPCYSLLLAVLLLPCRPAAAADAAPPPAAAPVAADSANLEDLEQQAFARAAERVAESVVRIETVGGLERVNEVLFGTGPTTGLIVDKQGYIVSSAFNFVNKPSSILVRLPDGTRKPAELVATDHNRMIVLLKVATDKPLPVPAVAPEREMHVGQWAIAVGRTFESDRPNVTVGVVSALRRIWGKALQTDAIVSPNNYGGPLLDIRGRVLGLIVPLSPEAANEVAGVEWYDSGIGFAVPLEFIDTLLPRLKHGKDLFPGLIGVTLGRNMQTGDATIVTCQPGSPAAEAGLKAGDKIVEIEGTKIDRAADMKREIAVHYAGDKIRVVALRGKDRIERTIEMVAKLEPYQHPFLGILPLRTTGKDGVAVRYVYPGGPAAAANIKPNDTITAFGGKPVKGRNELREELANRKLGEEVEIEVQSGGARRKLKLKLGQLPDDLPPAELPPARPAGGEVAQRPQVGRVALQVPEFKNEAVAYVPEKYDPNVPHGLIVWLHNAGGVNADELFSRCKSFCDRYDLILVAPKAADPQKWTPNELTFVQKLVEQVRSTYDIDPSRVVACGYEAGGAMAWTLAARNRDWLRGVIAVEAPPVGPVAGADPLNRFAVYLASAAKSGKARQINAAVEQLRRLKIPVTIKSTGEQAAELTTDELAEVARWIDMLDRI